MRIPDANHIGTIPNFRQGIVANIPDYTLSPRINGAARDLAKWYIAIGPNLQILKRKGTFSGLYYPGGNVSMKMVVYKCIRTFIQMQ